jgi:hypothetical protein
VNGGACVEVASCGTVLVRDSADPSSLIVSYLASAWRDFLAAAKADTFVVTC